MFEYHVNSLLLIRQTINGLLAARIRFSDEGVTKPCLYTTLYCPFPVSDVNDAKDHPMCAELREQLAVAKKTRRKKKASCAAPSENCTAWWRANGQKGAVRLTEVINPSTSCRFLTNSAESQDHSLSASAAVCLLPCCASTCRSQDNNEFQWSVCRSRGTQLSDDGIHEWTCKWLINMLRIQARGRATVDGDPLATYATVWDGSVSAAVYVYYERGKFHIARDFVRSSIIWFACPFAWNKVGVRHL